MSRGLTGREDRNTLIPEGTRKGLSALLRPFLDPSENAFSLRSWLLSNRQFFPEPKPILVKEGLGNDRKDSQHLQN